MRTRAPRQATRQAVGPHLEVGPRGSLLACLPLFVCSLSFFILICSEVAWNNSFLINLINFTALRMFSLAPHWRDIPVASASSRRRKRVRSLRRPPTV